jgi:hypothetical protein
MDGCHAIAGNEDLISFRAAVGETDPSLRSG